MRTIGTLLAASFVALPLLSAETSTINYSTFYNCNPETKALVQRVVTGFGGETALRAVRSVRKVAEIEESSPQGKKMQTQFEGIAVFPSSLYAKIQLASGSFTAVSTPDMAFMYPANAAIQHAALKLNDEERSQLTRFFYEEPLLVLRNRIDPSYLFACAGKAKVNGVDTDVLQVHASGADFQWYIDASGHVLRTTYGAKITDFGDFRKVNNVIIPFAMKTTNEGRSSVVHYKAYELNPPSASDALFVRPTLWMTRTSLPALGRRNRSRSSGFGDYVNAYMDDYGYSSDYADSFETYIYTIYNENYGY
jgi:hypothetical protein